MQLGVTRELWTKFEGFLKSLSTSNKIQKDFSNLYSLIF
jgi:hypothetical protein